jgi:hypothetical protein
MYRSGIGATVLVFVFLAIGGASAFFLLAYSQLRRIEAPVQKLIPAGETQRVRASGHRVSILGTCARSATACQGRERGGAGEWDTRVWEDVEGATPVHALVRCAFGMGARSGA